MSGPTTDRYSRQAILPEVGSAGQARLRGASVLVIGAGGLGSAVLQYLCAAGVGHLAIVDHDRVEESNLHRQPIYRMSDVGALKAQAAREALLGANPEVRIEAICERLTPANVQRLVGGVDVVVDAADSFAVTYVVSDECQRVKKALISASVLGLSGYVGAFCGGAPSYRAVFPEMPRQAGSCATAGVLGSAVGVMGTLQAHMVLSLLLDLQPAVLGQLVTVDFKTLRFGGFSFSGAGEPGGAAAIPFIAADQVESADLVIDLRTLAEAPVSPIAAALRIEVDAVEGSAGERLPSAPRVVLCCRTGVRAWRAARALQRRGHTNVALIAFGE
ncbi:MAG TPA: HesA/MoeB/ThiF family protein [Steroidobacteraceae bacterium]|jgi:molybdopterin/thiamine biosynthesis adenylyltransferase/rhodanese-related sulfurtransferase|nr:HesA/MoeB/ThiF family protein [Steroidobacteraceae bacterium]